MERGPQCGFFARQPAAPLSAGDHRSGTSLRDRQCRGAATEPGFAALVDEAAGIAAQKLSSLWSRDRKSTRLNSTHLVTSYAVCCLIKQKKRTTATY